MALAVSYTNESQQTKVSEVCSPRAVLASRQTFMLQRQVVPHTQALSPQHLLLAALMWGKPGRTHHIPNIALPVCKMHFTVKT